MKLKTKHFFSHHGGEEVTEKIVVTFTSLDRNPTATPPLHFENACPFLPEDSKLQRILQESRANQLSNTPSTTTTGATAKDLMDFPMTFYSDAYHAALSAAFRMDMLAFKTSDTLSTRHDVTPDILEERDQLVEQRTRSTRHDVTPDILEDR
jgi:hypothetical protein